ncbi:TPM domain-containing protein [Georgenia alba]|uniref:TPM domain-containing protein n=1 Tax=Georgenia alba TaxID=2233858 RepID=A0ABW2QAF0_9MICO
MRLRAASTLAAAALAVVPALTLASPAAAEDPMNLPEQVNDTTGTLSPGDVDEIQQAFDEVEGEVPFVAFISTFDGADAGTWSRETAEMSNFGNNNPLLVVAIDDSAWGASASNDAAYSQDDLDAMIEDQVLPELSDGDWSGAGVAYAEGVQDLATGGGLGGAIGFLGVLVAIVVVVGVIGVVVAVRRRSRRGQGEQQQAPRESKPKLPPDHPLNLPTEQLSARAGHALLAADDAIRSSEEELGFAKAQFGLQATDRFTAALEQAKEASRKAFSIRQKLDDHIPETEPQQRQMYADIIQLTSEIDDALSAQAEHFAKLRDIQARAPQALDEMEQRATEVERQIEGARAQLAQLANRYPTGALTSVSKNPDQAKALLTSARESVQEGREKVAGGDRQTAVTHVRIAEEAIGQAATLLQEVQGAGATLEDAAERLDVAIASITADVQDARRLAPDDLDINARRKEAEAAIAQGHEARTGGDPLAALQRLESAETAIDAALAGVRSEDENRRRAGAQLHDRLGRFDARLRSVSAYISTHRGSVGPEARTRLSEAERLAGEAHRLAGQDPVAAMRHLAEAERRAADAQNLAQRDASRWDDDWGGFGGGGFGGGGYGGGRRGGVDVGSLVLGGIIGSVLGGGRGGGFGGGWGGGGGFGGGGGGFGGGGFGGGGGRF